jgi:cell cycle checkpoint protein
VVSGRAWSSQNSVSDPFCLHTLASGSSTPYASTSSGSYFTPYSDYDEDNETQFTKFHTFFNRATSCQNLWSSKDNRRQIILLEDLPNILHPKTQEDFHACLKGLTESPPSDNPIPVVIVISDAGMRGEARDERIAGGGGWGRNNDQVMDVRSVVSKDLLHGPYVTQISYVPSFHFQLSIPCRLIPIPPLASTPSLRR